LKGPGQISLDHARKRNALPGRAAGAALPASGDAGGSESAAADLALFLRCTLGCGRGSSYL